MVASFDLADKRKLKNSFGWDFEEQAVKASYWDIAELAGAQGLPQGMLKMVPGDQEFKFFHLYLPQAFSSI